MEVLIWEERKNQLRLGRIEERVVKLTGSSSPDLSIPNPSWFLADVMVYFCEVPGTSVLKQARHCHSSVMIRAELPLALRSSPNSYLRVELEAHPPKFLSIFSQKQLDARVL